ncbi:threonine/serine exporter family protein [Dongshaea marina]|uniref:threonine/serine exporter family protein n=1 Tax=Dongshaea marina TaxID=2047966 RepID=UPI000D3E6FDB|nr:threonine/serine exporter family protein [Dongshaea marina]
MSHLLWTLLQDAFFAAIPAIGFGMLFNVPPRALHYCAIGGALGHSLRTLLMHFGLSIEMGTFIAAVMIGFLGVHWSRKFLAPRPVFTVPSIIPMVPGVFAFKAMISLVALNTDGFTQELFHVAIQNSLKAFFILAALSYGLTLPSLLLYRDKPIV